MDKGADGRSTGSDARSQLKSAGYVILKMADQNLVDRLRSVYDGIHLPYGHHFMATCTDLPRPRAAVTQSSIIEYMGICLADHFPKYQPFLAAFISKGAAGGSATAFHQDLTYTNERIDRALLIWMPLIDLTAESGGLQVVAGSHLWTDGLRPSGLARLPTASYQEEFAARATSLRLSAGEAVIYDAALIHGAPEHPPGEVRPAVAVAMAPMGAQLVRAHVDDRLRCFRVSSDHYLRQGVLERPEGSEPVEPWAEVVDEAIFQTVLEGLPSVEPALAESTDGDVDERSLPSVHRWRSPEPRRRQPALLDRRLDHRLGREGFVTFPFLDGAGVSRLRQRYGVLHGWQGQGSTTPSPRNWTLRSAGSFSIMNRS